MNRRHAAVVDDGVAVAVDVFLVRDDCVDRGHCCCLGGRISGRAGWCGRRVVEVWMMTVALHPRVYVMSVECVCTYSLFCGKVRKDMRWLIHNFSWFVLIRWKGYVRGRRLQHLRGKKNVF